MAAYYNEFDPKAAAWLRELIRQGHIADGEVDERSILDVRPADLRGFEQVHFFAGIGGWSYALRLAGWPDDRPVWTGSPPCQPFSAAGKQLGQDDERHLAPHFIELVASGRPPLLFGEQVASAAVFGKAAGGSRKRVESGPQWAWLDDLCDRLEAARYAVGASDLPSAGIGAPHIRQRTFFGAVDLGTELLEHAEGHRWQQWRPQPGGRGASGGCGAGGLADAHGRDASEERQQRGREHRQQPQDGDDCGLAQPHGGQRHGLADGEGCERDGPSPGWQQGHGEPAAGQQLGRMGNGIGAGLERHGRHGDGGHEPGWLDAREAGSIAEAGAVGLMDDRGRTGPLDGFWRAADWLYCRDGLWRPVEPGTFPLAHGLPARVGRLRGYGNAINPWLAAEFINAFETARGLMR